MANPRAVPDTSTKWQLWYLDTFDADSPPSLQAAGEGILRGLYELWSYTLREAIQDSGSASFSSFYLTWGNTPVTRVDAGVRPFHNTALSKLRRWAQEEGSSVLSMLGQLHYQFLEKSERWTAGTIDWSAEARELLARVESIEHPQELPLCGPDSRAATGDGA